MTRKLLLMTIRDKLSQDLIKAVFPVGHVLSLKMQRLHHNITATGSSQHKKRTKWNQTYTSTMNAAFFTAMEIKKGRSNQQQKRESRRTASVVAVLHSVAKVVKKATKEEE